MTGIVLNWLIVNHVGSYNFGGLFMKQLRMKRTRLEQVWRLRRWEIDWTNFDLQPEKEAWFRVAGTQCRVHCIWYHLVRHVEPYTDTELVIVRRLNAKLGRTQSKHRLVWASVICVLQRLFINFFHVSSFMYHRWVMICLICSTWGDIPNFGFFVNALI